MTKPSQATELVQLVDRENVYLFHDSQQVAFAKIDMGTHHEISELRRKPFRRWLARRFFNEFGKAPGSQAVQDALGVIEGNALYAGQEHEVHVRVAGHNGNVYVDLADDRWRAVRITPHGYEIQDEPEVLFRRPGGMLPLPAPAPGGSLADLQQFVNLDDDDWNLLLPSLAMMLNPTGPYPIVVFLGGQGRAKSTIARICRRLVDPNVSDLRSEPREVRDLMIAAANGWTCAFDNISRIPEWLSDALCRLATGGGFGTRELYSDSDEVLFDARRPVTLNGITDFVTRGDLLDRSLLLYPPEIDGSKRQSEAHLWESFGEAQPGIFGALLDAVSMALREKNKVRVARLPRMADFAIWGTAAEPALGLAPGDFMKAYSANTASAVAVVLEASRVSSYLLKLVEDRDSWADSRAWEGSATDLLDALNALADESVQRAKDWPKSPQAMSNALRRLAPTLKAEGIETEFTRNGQRRGIVLRLLPKPGSEGEDLQEQIGEGSSQASSASQASLVPDDDSDGYDDNDDLSRTHSYSGSVEAPSDLEIVRGDFATCATEDCGRSTFFQTLDGQPICPKCKRDLEAVAS